MRRRGLPNATPECGFKNRAILQRFKYQVMKARLDGDRLSSLRSEAHERPLGGKARVRPKRKRPVGELSVSKPTPAAGSPAIFNKCFNYTRPQDVKKEELYTEVDEAPDPGLNTYLEHVGWLHPTPGDELRRLARMGVPLWPANRFQCPMAATMSAPTMEPAPDSDISSV